MCGIVCGVGITEQDGVSMLMHQQKRGPDNIDHRIVNGVFMGHNRLSIIDLSDNGRQPMHTPRYTIAAVGEVYNYNELKTYLYASDDAGNCPSGNDIKTLLLYIDKYGLDQALKDYNGMLAMCLYDAVLEQIHVITDRFGQKPAYFFHSGAKMVIASSIGALLQLRDKWKIDEEGLASYWLLGASMGESTMISGIKKLTGSHHLTYDIRKNAVQIERYWSPTFQENTSGIEDLILDAINKVKVADVQPFVFLSGGIDSTLVASQFKGGAAVHLNGPEAKYAWEVREKFNLNMVVVDPQDINIEEALKDYAFQVGEPSMAALIPYITSKEVGKFAKVAISANGADELFFGYDRTGENITAKQIEHCFRDLHWNFKSPKYPIYGDHPFDQEKPGRGRWWELQTYVQFDLNRTLDGAAMCHSLEVRNPFLDHRLVEMALSIPEGKHLDPQLGRKAILKRMLQKMGFQKEFLTRPKLGFSLHKEPVGMEGLKMQAWEFVKKNGFLKCDDKKLNGRDERYLKMAALSFYYWHNVWKEKLH